MSKLVSLWGDKFLPKSTLVKILVTVISLISSGFTLADATIRVQHDAVMGKKSGVSPFYVKEGKIRIDDIQSDKTAMIFDSKRQVMTVINHEKKSYLEFNEEVMAQISVMLNNMKQQFMQQFAGLPPAQRAQMEQMAMPAFQAMMGSNEKAPTPVFTKTSQKKKISGFNCTVSDVSVDGVKSGELCTAAFTDLKLSEADYKTMQSFADFFGRVAAAFPGSKDLVKNFEFWQLADNQLPVSYGKMVHGKLVPSVQLDSIESKSLGEKMFKVPEGYTPEKLNEQLTRMPKIRLNQ